MPLARSLGSVREGILRLFPFFSKARSALAGRNAEARDSD